MTKQDDEQVMAGIGFVTEILEAFGNATTEQQQGLLKFVAGVSCPQCGKQFKSKRAMLDHLLSLPTGHKGAQQ